MLNFIRYFYTPVSYDTITYIVVIDEEIKIDFTPDPMGYSLFQGFSKGILGTNRIFNKISFLPASGYEFFIDRKTLIQQKCLLNLNRRVLTVGKNTTAVLGEMYNTFYTVVVYDGHTAFNKILGNSSSWVKQDEFLDYTEDKLYNEIKKSPSSKALETFRKDYGAKRRIKIPLIPDNKLFYTHHKVFYPSFAALQYSKKKCKIEFPYLAKNDEECLKKIYDYAKSLNETCNSFNVTPRISLTLYAPSIQNFLYNNKYIPKLKEASIRKSLKSLVNQKTFLATISQDDLLHDKIAQLAFQLFVYTRALEMEACESIMNLYATNTFSPILRFPWGINTPRWDLVRFCGAARGNGAHKLFKLEKIRKGISSQAESSCKEVYTDLIKETHGHIKIIGDYPLELMNVGDIPLNIKNETSRIPTTSGNLFHMALSNFNEIEIPLHKLRNIIIARSFTDNDRIKNLIATAKSLLRDLINELNIKIIDINCEKDLLSLLDPKYPILIYDGHGKYNNQTGLSSLVIGGKEFDLFSVGSKIPLLLPPIVILSACDTFPLDGPQASAAMSFFHCGAKTVLGTFNAINAIHSAVFIGRLLLRLSDNFMVPALKNYRLTWSAVVHGLQRMQYCSDLIFDAAKLFSLDIESREKLLYFANILTNPPQLNWYERLLEEISKHAKKDFSYTSTMLKKNKKYSEACSYVQIGYPELIRIIK